MPIFARVAVMAIRDYGKRHRCNLKIATVKSSHNHRSLALPPWQRGGMRTWDQGNGSKQADRLPGNQLVTINGVYGGKRWVFSWDRKARGDFVLRRERGREFHIVGAEKEKDRRPMALLILGTSSEFVVEKHFVIQQLWRFSCCQSSVAFLKQAKKYFLCSPTFWKQLYRVKILDRYWCHCDKK